MLLRQCMAYDRFVTHWNYGHRLIRRVRGWIWRLRDGDNQLRIQPQQVGRGGTMMEIGAYDGSTVRRFCGNADINIFAFEPIPVYADGLRRKFENDPNVTVVQVAVGSKAGYVDVFLNGEATSQFAESESQLRVECIDIAQWLGERRVEVLSINAEGAEFEILDRLIASGKIVQISLLEVQFHRVLPDSGVRRREIRKALAKNFDQVHCTPWVWEVWNRKLI